MTDEIRELLARRLPGYEIRSVSRLGEGLDNVSYEVNGELIVRASKEVAPAHRSEATRRETDLLGAVAELSTLQIPKPVFVGPEAGVIAYFRLPGLPLIDHPVADPARLAPALGGFLGCLQRTPLEKVEHLVKRDAYPLVAWLEDSEWDYREISAHLPAGPAAGSRASSATPRRKCPVPRRSATTTSGLSTCWWTSRRAAPLLA